MEYQALLEPVRVWRRSETIARPSPVPERGGLYAWYFQEAPDMRIDLSRCHSFDGLWLLYAGISPTEPPRNGRPPSRQNLRKRIQQHYCLNAEGSTLRLSLGCLLADRLGIELRRVGSGKRLTFTHEGEAKLNDWMEANAFVTWLEADEPWMLERKMIESWNCR